MKQTELAVSGKSPDTGLLCLVAVARHLGVETEEQQLRQKYSYNKPQSDWKDLQFLAGKLKFKTQQINVTPDELREVPVPAVGRLKNGNYVVIGWNSEDTIFLSDPLQPKPVAVSAQQFYQIWTGELMLFTAKFDWHMMVRKYNLDWFYNVIIHYKKYLGEALVASFFLQILGLATPLFTQVIIDKVIGNNGISTLDVLGVVLLILFFFQAVMGFLRTYILTQTTNKFDAILGTRLFRHIVALPVPYFEHRRVGDTLMRVGAMNSIREFLTGTTLTVLLDVLFSFVFLSVMFYYSATLTWAALAVVPIYFIQNVLTTPIYKRKLDQLWRAGAASNAFIVEAITGIQTVKALAVEPQFRHKWENLLARTVGTAFEQLRFTLAVSSFGSLIQQLSTFLILWLGGHMVMEGKLTLGQLIAFQMLSGQAVGPLITLVGMWPTVQQTGMSMERLGDILNSRAEPVLAPQPHLPPIAGKIVFEDVSFRYRLDAPQVLTDISVTIQAGQKVGIVGRSGSGKSTLTNLIQALYIPEEGKITIDDQELSKIHPGWFRKQIGVVLQENYLFSGSVRDNIAIARPSASMTEVIHAARMAGAHDFILELAEGYDTKVGERGASLSGGQRQRLAIARALFQNPAILIFDEATSALDYESERIIMDNLQQMAAGRTLLMIAHRLTAVKYCDTILVIDQGRIVENGSHAALIKQQGIYYNLYLQQEG